MGTNPKLYEIDINILTRLQADSNLTHVQLADAADLSPSPCLKRVKRLEHVVVFTEVTLNDHLRNDFIKF